MLNKKNIQLVTLNQLKQLDQEKLSKIKGGTHIPILIGGNSLPGFWNFLRRYL